MGQHWNVVHPQNAFDSTYLINCAIEMGNSEQLFSLLYNALNEWWHLLATKCLLLYRNYIFTSYFIDNTHVFPHTLLINEKPFVRL